MSLLLFAAQTQAASVRLDLHAFFTVDTDVEVAADGHSVSLRESEFVSLVTLVNDSSVGDAAIIDASAGHLLAFHYELDQPTGNVDEFSAYLFDTSAGPFHGSRASVSVSSSESATAFFELSNHSGVSLGLQFELYDPGADTGTTLRISDLALVDPSADSDGDDLLDGDEIRVHKTRPFVGDTDGDGAPDGAEVSASTDPLDPASFPGSIVIVHLLAGDNLVALPGRAPDGATTCFEFLQFLGGESFASKIDSVDVATQETMSCFFASGVPTGSNFAVSPDAPTSSS